MSDRGDDLSEVVVGSLSCAHDTGVGGAWAGWSRCAERVYVEACAAAAAAAAAGADRVRNAVHERVAQHEPKLDSHTE